MASRNNIIGVNFFYRMKEYYFINENVFNILKLYTESRFIPNIIIEILKKLKINDLFLV